jgi:ATP-dependent Clp protease ATP-binding subunit ClpC
MDRGTTTDNRGQQLNFASTMLVYTSNLGYSRLQQSSDPIGFGTTDARAEFQRRELLGDLKRELSPEFINRLQIVHFNPLSQNSIDRIFDLELERIAARYRRFHHLEISVTKASRQALLARGYSPEYGARHLARVLNEVCNVAISKKLRRDASRDEAEDEASSLISYIQEARREERTADFEMLQRRVLARARARVPYRRVVVDHSNGRFAYRTS